MTKAALPSGRPVEQPSAGRAGGRAGQGGRGTGSVFVPALRLPHTDWLRHEIVITGPAPTMASFQEAAAGPGNIPWEYPDLDLEEEDRVQALVQPPDGSRGLDVDSARVLARELREAIFDHQKKVVAAEVVSRACPFDLHRLVPVPAEILQLGPDHAASQAWLQSSWGTTRPLRHVQLLPDKPRGAKRKTVRRKLEFFSADWTPWAALAAIREAWRALGFDVRPDYDDG
jgi:hypothetical protein